MDTSEPLPKSGHPVTAADMEAMKRDLETCTRDGQRLSQLLAEEKDRTEALEAALRTIANQEWSDDTDVWLWAACILWGPQCYWCMGFNHPEAWTVGCQCKKDEPWA
jgi:hypothetical protein